MSEIALEGDDEHRVVELLGRIAQKDRVALREFYDAYAVRVGRFLMKHLRDPERVDETVNDVMLAVWQSAGDYDPARARFSTWLFGIAYNKCLKVWEKARRHEQEISIDDDAAPALGDDGEAADGDSAPADSNSPERTVMGWELGAALASALEVLAPEHRLVLELTFAEGLGYAEIAELTGCPVATVKTRVFYARKKLFEALERRGFSPAVLTQESL